MIKTILITIVAASVSIAAAQAKTVKVPNEDFAIASLTVPDSWKTQDSDKGFEGVSKDGAVYLSIVGVGSEKSMNDEIDAIFAMLKERNVTLDESSKKENKFKINDLDATELLYQGKDEDGPAGISITFVPIKGKMLIITYWVSTDKEAEHQQEVGKILTSLKPVS